MFTSYRHIGVPGTDMIHLLTGKEITDEAVRYKKL